MADIATTTVQSLVTRLQAIANMNGRAFQILSEDELIAKTKLISMPAIGVVYTGLTPRPSPGPSHKTGRANTLTVMVLVFYKSSFGIGEQQADALKVTAMDMLGTIRDTLKDTTGPSGHYWEFGGESPAAEKGGLVVWLQRWSIPVLI